MCTIMFVTEIQDLGGFRIKFDKIELQKQSGVYSKINENNHNRNLRM